jgi:hypothetical protein
MTITGVNLAVAAGIVAAIGEISRFNSPQKLVSYFGLNPRVRQSGLGAAHHGRVSKIGRNHARAMVEAAWAAAKGSGPLHAFFVRIRARRPSDRCGGRGSQAHCALLAFVDEGQDNLWARPALVANKTRAMQLQAGHPQQKGSRRGPAYAYKIKSLRDREILIAAQAEQSYERFVSQWKPRRPKTGARAPQLYSRQCMRLYWHPTLSGSRRRHRRSGGNEALLPLVLLEETREVPEVIGQPHRSAFRKPSVALSNNRPVGQP